jgi:two-component system CheB/CheR fusion protein
VGANGGLTFVQSPESALFPAMPSAAITLGNPDWIATPQAIAERLSDCLLAGNPMDPGQADDQPLILSRVIQHLKEATGIDFSQYKESTLLRQLHRRMAVTGLTRAESYLQLLSANSNEARALMRNLLVTVTAFFRNPEAFAELKRQLTPRLQASRLTKPFRVWVPGCSTGEEAYTIAMIISEILGHPQQLAQMLKIFATDTLWTKARSLKSAKIYVLASFLPAITFARILPSQTSTLSPAATC